MPPAGPRHRTLPEIRVSRVINHTVFSGEIERRSLRLSEQSVEAIDQRVDVLINRIGGGHSENSRAGVALLMFVEPDSGEPIVPQNLGGQLALLLGEEK